MVCQCSSHIRESMRCNSLSIINAWWKWQTLLLLWWFMFLWNWCIFRSCLCVSFYHFLSSVGTRWSWWDNWAVVFVCSRNLGPGKYAFSFRGFFSMPMCISRPNRAKWSERRVIPFLVLVLTISCLSVETLFFQNHNPFYDINYVGVGSFLFGLVIW